MSSKFLNLSTDNTLGGNSPSDNKAVSEKAIKEYVDGVTPTESTVSGWGFTKNAGTVTSVNNVSPVSGNVTLTASDVGAQPTLVSGTNIKTINNTSLLGSGNIDIQGGGGGSYTAGTGLDLQNSEFSIAQKDSIIATVVGTLTESDGVYSGFSTSNYLQLPELLIGSEDTYEIQLKFTGAGILYGDASATVNDYQNCYGSATRLFKVFAVPNGYAYDGTYQFDSNTTHWVRITRTVSSGSYSTTVTISTDDTNWTQFGSTDTRSGTQPSTTFNLTIGANKIAGALSGYIDIKGCYIKKNGDYWWDPNNTSTAVVAKATNSLYGLVKPDGSTITVNNGVISASASFPSQTGNAGKFLTTNGTDVSWGAVDALPTQTSQSGKFLTTNGTTASWANASAVTFRVWS